VSEQEIYDSAVEPTQNISETPTEAPTEAKPERARDEHGRYVKAATEQTEEVVAEPTAPVEGVVEPPAPDSNAREDARVPSWRLAEESQRRRDAENALNELRNEFRNVQMQMMQMRAPQQPQEAQEAPDIFADPQGFVQNLQQSFDQRLKGLQLEQSLRFAHLQHGEKFNEAYNAFTDYVTKTRDQASYQRVMASSDPGDALVQWYKDQTLQKELGGSDLNTFIQKRQEEWLKDPAVQAKVIEAFKATQQAQTPSNIINTPPSLSRAPSAASAHDDGGSSPQDIYNYATRR
jgi:hypothetical protein